MSGSAQGVAYVARTQVGDAVIAQTQVPHSRKKPDKLFLVQYKKVKVSLLKSISVLNESAK